MIWLAPWALLGVIGVALPTLIHLLGRGHADRRRFPSLRFLTASRLLPTQRTKIHDPLLLAVRAAIIALAAVALARPLLLSANRKRTLDRGIARIAIVDTGSTMSDAARGVARDSARAFTAASQAGLVVESAPPRSALAGAANWLAREGRRSEIAIYSTFPSGTIDSLDLAAIPASVGLRLIPIAAANVDTIARMSSNERLVTASVRYDNGTATAQWTSDGPTTSLGVRLLASPADAAALNALNAAMSSVAIPQRSDAARVVAVVFGGAPQRARLEGSASPLRTPWMVDLLARMPSDLQATRSAEGSIDGRAALLFFPGSPPGSLESARLVAAIARSESPSPVEGRGVGPIAPATLARWSRPASASDSPCVILSAAKDPSLCGSADGRSDARWVWGAVIALLALELWLRRSRTTAVEADAEARARAA